MKLTEKQIQYLLKNEKFEFKEGAKSMQPETTIISYKEYELLKENLKEHKKIKELKPIAEMMEREIDRLIVWM